MYNRSIPRRFPRRTSSGNGFFTAGCYLAILIFNIAVGGWSVHYLLNLFGKEIPFLADTAIGLFVAELSVPAAVIAVILHYFGVF